ncbi:MAG: rod shape-determining protein RodA [Candidatus Eisenbacteria bacterium]|nr:rod shape-determining protein RodA [Candidatus Eisenbacteria bacterium]
MHLPPTLGLDSLLGGARAPGDRRDDRLQRHAPAGQSAPRLLREALLLSLPRTGGLCRLSLPSAPALGGLVLRRLRHHPLLLAARFADGEEHYGAKRWFRAGPIKFQPSEMAKLAFAASFARFLAGKRVDLTQPRTLLLTLFGVGVPTLLVLKSPISHLRLVPRPRRPDDALGRHAPPRPLRARLPGDRPRARTPPDPLARLHRHRGRRLREESPLALGARRLPRLHVGLHIAAPLVISKLHPYQQARIESFLNPEADPSGAGYQDSNRASPSVSGGVFGKGYLQGSQKALAYLPMQHNDFIFSVIGEEFGFVSAALVVLAFGTLVYRAIEIAKQARSPFASLLGVGIGGLVFYHASVNMAMTMGLFPVTGLPLPFVSYGGTFLLTMMAALGLLMNVAVHRFDY